MPTLPNGKLCLCESMKMNFNYILKQGRVCAAVLSVKNECKIDVVLTVGVQNPTCVRPSFLNL